MKRLAAFLILTFAVTVVAQNRPYPPPPNDPWAYGPQNNQWNPSWNQRPNPHRGACFYTSSSFHGNRFCVRSGDRLAFAARQLRRQSLLHPDLRRRLGADIQ